MSAKKGIKTKDRHNSFMRKVYFPLKKRVKIMKPLVNDQVGALRVESVLGANKIFNYTLQHTKIHCENVGLMRVLDTIHHSTIEREKLMGKTQKLTALKGRLYIKRKNQLRIHRENIIIGRRIHEIRYGTREKFEKTRDKVSKGQIYKFKLPTLILQKYEGKVSIPQDQRIQYKLFRPCIYFELEALNERYIGRYTFELYTEACPMIVLELVRFFLNSRKEELRFPRIYRELWTEFEIPVDIKRFSNVCKIEYDMRALDNASGSGIISFDKENFKYLKFGILNLTISFKPLSVVKNKRIAIGRIISGRKNLSILREYGRKNGNTIKKIVATKLGVIANEACR